MRAITAKTPPSPDTKLLTGIMRDFQRDPLRYLTDCARQHGDFVRARFLYFHCYFLFHPDHIEEMLVTQAPNFIKGASFRTPLFERVVGNGLLSSEGNFWKRQRRLAQPAFHRQRINAYAETMVEYAERSTTSWQQNTSLDIHQAMMQLALEVVVKTLFDTDIADQASDVGDAMEIVVEPFKSQATFKWILDNRFPTPTRRRFYRSAKTLDNIIFKMIHDRRQSGEDRGDLLSMLLEARDEDGSAMDDQQLRDEVMNIFIAGHETTALALTWSWFLLSEHPEIERKLHEELDSVLHGRRPTLHDLSALQYTEKIVKEVLRLYPPAWGLNREAVEECEIGGYRVAAKSQFYGFQWVIHRDARYFPEPDRFIPERWTEDFVKQLPRYAYFPFGGGARLCIGNSFAMMEAVLILATIAQKFRLRLLPDQNIHPVPSITLRPNREMMVKIEKRDI